MQSERKRQIEQLWRRRLPVAVDEARAYRRFVRLMRGFDDEDLDTIWRAVESGGRDSKLCAPGPPMDDVVNQPTCSKIVDAVDMLRRTSQVNHVPESEPPPVPPVVDPMTAAFESGLIPQIDAPMSVPYLCCKMWRWRELQVDAALHRFDVLPWCRFKRMTIDGTTVSCCNPYHYALWIKRKSSIVYASFSFFYSRTTAAIFRLVHDIGHRCSTAATTTTTTATTATTTTIING
jgi:hypothetical protein